MIQVQYLTWTNTTTTSVHSTVGNASKPMAKCAFEKIIWAWSISQGPVTTDMESAANQITMRDSAHLQVKIINAACPFKPRIQNQIFRASSLTINWIINCTHSAQLQIRKTAEFQWIVIITIWLCKLNWIHKS